MKKAQVSNRVKKTYESVDAFRQHLESVSRKRSRLTLEVDRLLASNSYTLSEIMNKIESMKKTIFKDSNDFSNLQILKKHIKYRAAHNCFRFKLDHLQHVLLMSIEDNAQEIDF
jgi:regulator of replication initiation timing